MGSFSRRACGWSSGLGESVDSPVKSASFEGTAVGSGPPTAADTRLASFGNPAGVRSATLKVLPPKWREPVCPPRPGQRGEGWGEGSSLSRLPHPAQAPSPRPSPPSTGARGSKCRGCPDPPLSWGRVSPTRDMTVRSSSLGRCCAIGFVRGFPGCSCRRLLTPDSCLLPGLASFGNTRCAAIGFLRGKPAGRVEVFRSRDTEIVCVEMTAAARADRAGTAVVTTCAKFRRQFHNVLSKNEFGNGFVLARGCRVFGCGVTTPTIACRQGCRRRLHDRLGV